MSIAKYIATYWDLWPFFKCNFLKFILPFSLVCAPHFSNCVISYLICKFVNEIWIIVLNINVANCRVDLHYVLSFTPNAYWLLTRGNIKMLSPWCRAGTLAAQRWEGWWTSMSSLSRRPAGLHLFPVLLSSTEFSPLPHNRRLIKRDWLL